MSYVITDIEWIAKGDYINPTQISAIKVNVNWGTEERFSKKIKPRSKHFYTWEHVAYTGGTAESFLSARSAFHVLEEFSNWLNEDDVLLWWFSTGMNMLNSLMKSMHKRELIQKQLILRDYLDSFLDGKTFYKWGAYETARELHLQKYGEEHSSMSDVLTVQSILKGIKFPQKLLKDPPVTREIENPPCEKPVIDLRPYSGNNGKSNKKKKHKTVHRVFKDRQERCRDIIRRMHCKFIYTPRSAVFHKSSCKLIRITLDVKGCQKYATAINSGRVPCKVCKPTVDDEQKKKPKKIKKVASPQSYKLKYDTQKAIKRLKQAKEERYSGALITAQTEQEKRDIITLTSTEYAFWVGKGYKNFHLRTCPRLTNLNGLTGFKTYGDAVAAGFSACKTCRPTKKNNVNLSIPITSRERVGEKVEDLYKYCKEYGYPCSEDGDYFCLQTPVGKWKINLTERPVRVKHINLVKGSQFDDYHDQPRLFLSLTDAILYIRRHDNKLI